MKMLFIVPYVPSLIRVRPYNLIRFLSERGHQVHVYTLWTNEKEQEEVGELKELCTKVTALRQSKMRSYWNSLWAVPTSLPLQTVFSWNQGLFEQIVEDLKTEEFDLLHIEHIRGAKYGLELQKLMGDRLPPIVWDSVDCISMLFRQAAEKGKGLFGKVMTWFELGRTEKMERRLLKKFDRVLVTSRLDQEALEALQDKEEVGTAPVTVLRNGVDLTFFQPDPSVMREQWSLVVSGKMSYHANHAMVTYLVHEIMPLVWQKNQEVRLYIVGKDPSDDILAMGRDPRVIVTGTVIDLRPFIRKAAISVAPVVYGAGIQNKVLEAMACGAPVICSSKAVAALDVVSNRDLLVADSAEEFADYAQILFDDPERMRKMGQAGLDYVRANHDWTQIAIELEKIYQDVSE